MLFAYILLLLCGLFRVNGLKDIETLDCYHCGSETDSGWDLPCEKFNFQPMFEGPCTIDHFCFKTLSNTEWTALLMLLTIVSVSLGQSQYDEPAYSQNNADEQNYPYVLQLFQDFPSIERRNYFFLKASKTVPRIGRRQSNNAQSKEEPNKPELWKRGDLSLKAAKSDPRVERRNDFFLKASKTVPRIGRRDDVDLLLSNNYPSISKKNDFHGVIGGEASAWPWFRNPDLIPKVFKKKVVSKVNEPILQIWEADSSEPWNSIGHLDQDFINKERVEPRIQAEV